MFARQEDVARRLLGDLGLLCEFPKGLWCSMSFCCSNSNSKIIAISLRGMDAG